MASIINLIISLTILVLVTARFYFIWKLQNFKDPKLIMADLGCAAVVIAYYAYNHDLIFTVVTAIYFFFALMNVSKIVSQNQELSSTEIIVTVPSSLEDQTILGGNFCSTCGASIAANALFCSQCGSSISSVGKTRPLIK